TVNFPDSWKVFLCTQSEELGWIVRRVESLVPDESTLIPRPEDILAPFRLTTKDSLRVLLFDSRPSRDCDDATGQPRALGYAFGHRVPSECPKLRLLALGACTYRRKYAPSSPCDPDRDFDYSLKSWASQGVLLLNTSPLTTRPKSRKANARINTAFRADF